MFRTFLLAALLVVSLLSGTASAQVFIPDLNERAWLNAEIPGIVDANGIMDTLDPEIAMTDSVLIHFTDYIPSVELSSLPYLDSVVYCEITTGMDVVWSSQPFQLVIVGCPRGLAELSIDIPRGSVELPALPASLDILEVGGWYDDMSLDIVGLPDSMEQISLSQVSDIQWPAGSFVRGLYMGWVQTGWAAPIPPIRTDKVQLGSILSGDMPDMSSVHADTVFMGSCHLSGPIAWPMGLHELSLVFTTVEGTLSELPGTLHSFSVEDGGPFCLPWLPDSISHLDIQYSGVECIPNWPSALSGYMHMGQSLNQLTAIYCSVLNTDCPGVNPGIGGRVFIDADQDGQYDPGEPPLPESTIVLQPGQNVVGCTTDGTWQVGVLPGSYTIVPSSTYPYMQSFSPAEHTANVPEPGDVDTLNYFSVNLMPDISDLRAQFWASHARPGFDNRLYLTCQNYGTVPMDAQLTLEFDEDQTWVGSSVTPSAQTGTSVTWALPGMAVGTSQTITVDLNTAAGVPLGTPIMHTLSALPTAGDEAPSDNVVVFTDSVVGSYDPNDKSLTPSAMSPAQVLAGSTPIVYTIRFQNTGTYPAERVLILDTLPSGLQVASIQFLGSSHACTWYVSEGVLYVLHEGIALPDSSSDETASHGYVRFSILPETGLADGEEVVNIAHIVFDFNEPIVTPPAVFRVDAVLGMDEAEAADVRVHPNPVHERLWITLPRNGKKAMAYGVQDLFGRNVLAGLTGNDSAVDVGLLPAGVYMLSVKSEAGAPCVRFVKQ